MPELSHRRRLLVLAICCLSLLMVSIDNTVLNVAIPAMQRDFHASMSGLQWTIDAYLIVVAGLMITSGSTADRLGRRRVFQFGLVLFTAGSLLCSLAPGLGWLVAARVVQAAGGSMLNPVAMSIITNTFTEPRERARAIGVWGGVVGISMAAGPLVGGVLVDSVGWRSIFWLNLPIGLAALVLTRLFVPESRAPHPRRPDPAGQLLMIVTLGALTYAIIEGAELGWTSPVVLGCAAAAALALALFVRHALRVPEPLIDVRFFRSLPFSGATLIAICAFSALAGFLFLNSIYLQSVRGLTALHAGLYLLPMAAVTGIVAPFSGRLTGSRGPRLPLQIAGATMLASALLFAAFDGETRDSTLFAAYILFGIGFGTVNSPITNTAVSGMPRAQAGVAAAVASTSRQIGQALGVAVFGAVLGVAGASTAHGGGAHGGGGRPALAGADFVAAARPAYWIMAGCAAAVLVLGTITTGRRAVRTAERTAAATATDTPRTPVRTP
ncbi:MFS transporter [Actinomadura rupiterrae]|uniref:MFS transporter n=1 Tax=Actinomadura rupiterrae TaxID=559627 RepID=UPI0020A28344|nr:MFS transporter [Actinomadura rupiterrae]MCP2338712.1 EmrB/QacA subfamily drug resistance transporter [Actinomadura rupiterrae]